MLFVLGKGGDQVEARCDSPPRKGTLIRFTASVRPDLVGQAWMVDEVSLTLDLSDRPLVKVQLWRALHRESTVPAASTPSPRINGFAAVEPLQSMGDAS